MVAVWVNPRLLDWVGGEGISRWILDHRWIHLLAMLPLGFLTLISIFELRDDPRKRAAGQALADSLGGSVVRLDRIDPTYGIPDGPGLRVPLGRWFLVVGAWKRKREGHTVATVRVESRSAFSFVAKGIGREPELVQGLQRLAAGYSVSHGLEHAGDTRTAMAAAALAYLAQPPVVTGIEELDRAIVLRANQSGTARTIFVAGAVVSAISALNEQKRRWELSFHPAEAAGTAEMRLEYPGTLKDVDTLRAAQALMGSVLAEMTRAEIVAA